MIEQDKLDIKSPIFKAKPGWGGKLKNWLGSNLESKILPAAATLVLVFGLYNFLNKDGSKTAELETDLESEIIEKIAQPRQGLTHLARAALSEYLNSKGFDLSPEQKLFAETYLVTKLNNRLVHAGDTVTFRINDLTETIERAQTLTDYQLQEWGKYLK